MHTLHLDLLNEQSALELEAIEAAFILHMITYYNDNRNLRKDIPNYITSQNKLAKELKVDRRTVIKILDALAHNVEDLHDDDKLKNPKILFNYKVNAKGLEIWKIKKI